MASAKDVQLRVIPAKVAKFIREHLRGVGAIPTSLLHAYEALGKPGAFLVTLAQR